MAALRTRRGHYIFALWFLSFFLSFSSPKSQQLEIGCLSYFGTWCGPSVNLECTSEMCCMRLDGNAGRKKSPKNRHLGTIAKSCRAVSSQLRHVSTIGKKLVKHQYLLYMSSYGELWPTNGWDRFGSLGHPSKFQRVSTAMCRWWKWTWLAERGGCGRHTLSIEKQTWI